MTEAEWLACAEPGSMLSFLGSRATVRKRKHRLNKRTESLLAAACCRRVWHLMPYPECEKAVEVAEEFADSQVSDEERQDAEAVAREFASKAEFDLMDGSDFFGSDDAAEAARLVASGYGGFGLAKCASAAAITIYVDDAGGDEESRQGVFDAAYEAREVAERAAQAHLLRDILGNPFRKVTCASTWRSADVIALAQACYDERHLPGGELHADRLAVLADALTDAGCDDAAILSHLRSPGPHVRGCWAVDLVLGKE